ncbi:hypothetical protein ACPYO6_15395 [Georgenia sp. Z1344]|uniref:hypothetical protein n=1 Tax=Georgenia sp. Z1344 TaxID=3416706 RepID=UPI003CF50E8B
MADAEMYIVNYRWAEAGPEPWDESSIVTLRADLVSSEDGDTVWSAIEGWWSDSLERTDDDAPTAHEGGCVVPRPERAGPRIVVLLRARGEAAFDEIARFAAWVHRLATVAEPAVAITWTELPHTNAGDESRALEILHGPAGQAGRAG